MAGDYQSVTITPDAKLFKNLEGFAQARGISMEAAVNVILFDMLKLNNSKPKIVRSDNLRKAREIEKEKPHSELNPDSEQSIAEMKVKRALQIMVQIAIRIVEEKHASEEKAAKENDAAKEAKSSVEATAKGKNGRLINTKENGQLNTSIF